MTKFIASVLTLLRGHAGYGDLGKEAATNIIAHRRRSIANYVGVIAIAFFLVGLNSLGAMAIALCLGLYWWMASQAADIALKGNKFSINLFHLQTRVLADAVRLYEDLLDWYGPGENDEQRRKSVAMNHGELLKLVDKAMAVCIKPAVTSFDAAAADCREWLEAHFDERRESLKRDQEQAAQEPVVEEEPALKKLAARLAAHGCSEAVIAAVIEVLPPALRASDMRDEIDPSQEARVAIGLEIGDNLVGTKLTGSFLVDQARDAFFHVVEERNHKRLSRKCEEREDAEAAAIVAAAQEIAKGGEL